MNIAILTISSLSLICSAGTLVIMAKTAQELKQAKDDVEANVETFKTKTTRNFELVKKTLSELEF